METEERIEESAANALKFRGLTLAVAESCTGGLLSAMITSVAGASEYFKGGVIAYSNDIKVGVLGVSETTLAEVGAVSARTAAEMAIGVMGRLGADVGISITGIAGPGGGSPEKPVGTVFIGYAAKGAEEGAVRTAARGYSFEGRRAEVRVSSAEAALEGLIEFIQG